MTTQVAGTTGTLEVPQPQAADGGQGLSLAALLDVGAWQLPGWNEVSVPPIQTTETLQQLDLSIALLSRYRNSLRPFSKLSPDLLILIFLELQEDHWDPYQPTFGSYQWMVVAKVCHSWREVALGCPILWKQLSTRYPKAALVALERSVDAGFCLVVPEGSEGERASSVLEAVAAHVGRLRWLYLPSNLLRTNDGNVHQMLLPLIRSAAPTLETIDTAKIRCDGSCVALPTLFAGQTPRLHRLRIHYMYPQLSSVSLSNLKYLGFSGKKRDPITMTVSALLDILEKCPLLETLKAEKVAWVQPADDDDRKVELEHLQMLEMGRSNASLVANILGRLKTPECAMRLKVWLDRYEDTKFYVGIPGEQELEFDHYLHDIKKMHINFTNNYEGVVIHGATKTMPFEISGMLEPMTVNNLGDMDSISGTVFKSIIGAFDLENLEEFAFTEMRNNARWTGFTKKLWTDTFRRMPNLKSFHITTDGCYDEGYSRCILAALSCPDERTGRLPCPSLENMHVWGDKTWSSLQFYTMAEDRHKAGHPLKRVSMRLSHYASFDNPDDTDMPLLRRYVETVDLDPIDITFPDFPDTI